MFQNSTLFELSINKPLVPQKNENYYTYEVPMTKKDQSESSTKGGAEPTNAAQPFETKEL